MTITKREEKFIQVSIESNSNKWWTIKQEGTSVYTFNGRVGYAGKGTDGANPVKNFTSEFEAEKFVEKKIKEKLAKGYVPQSTINAGQSVIIKPQGDLRHIARTQIQSDSPETIKLIEYLVQTNAHNISMATSGKITFDEGSGLFKTPLGFVTKDGIDRARGLLTEISTFVIDKKFADRAYHRVLSDYLMIIPQNTGMKLNPETLYPDLIAVQNQNSILDSLEASLQTILSAPPGDNGSAIIDPPKLFDVKLTSVSQGEVFEMLRKFYQKTLNRVHTSSNMDVKAIWEVEIGHMKSAFEKQGKPIGNVQQLWHGTKVGNLLSILKNGYILPGKLSSAAITGAMFGRGIYFSDQSTKSLNYATNFWSGGSRESACFMLLNNVAMGKSHTPSGPTSSPPPNGYDSYFAKAGVSGVMNNEMIVFNTHQISPKYLIQFSVGGR